MKPFVLPKLPYEFNELEPALSKEVLEIHYTKHHAAYIKNLNEAEQKLKDAIEKEDLSQQIEIQDSISFNGGGHINHSLYWENLAPSKKGGGMLPTGSLKKKIEETFGSLEQFIDLFSKKAASVQGSGWAWLVYNPLMKRLGIFTTQNHMIPSTYGMKPLLCIDVWEHAYYLQYKNLRGDYLKNIWNVVNWNIVEQRFLSN